MNVYIHVVALEEDNSENARRRGYIAGPHTDTKIVTSCPSSCNPGNKSIVVAGGQTTVKNYASDILPNDVRCIKSKLVAYAEAV